MITGPECRTPADGLRKKETRFNLQVQGGSSMDIIRVQNLKKAFGKIQAVNDISFHVQAGELFGFLGVNGAGKSTTISILSTVLKPDEGNVRIAGYELGKENEEIRRQIGIVMQENMLDDLLTVEENLICRASLYHLNKSEIHKSLQDVSAVLEIGDLLKRRYVKLSGGQKRRCEIAASLMHTPSILFLDEPTTGLDPGARQAVWKIVENLRRKRKMTVFVTTHYMEEAARAGHIALISCGRLLDYGTPFELKEKYAKDRLLLIPRENRQESLARHLSAINCQSGWQDERLCIPLNSTMDSLEILSEIRDMISGFEVIQGTMDDVFLQMTKEENANV